MRHELLCVSTGLLLFCAAATPARATTQGLREGHYEGYVKLPRLGMKIPVVVDTALSQGANGSTPRMDVWTKLSLGSFGSHEFITKHYILSNFDPNHTSINLSIQDDPTYNVRDLVWNLQTSEDGTRLSGGLESLRENVRDGLVELRYTGEEDVSLAGAETRLSSVFPETPIYPLFTGTYSCPDCVVYTTIQLELSRFERNLDAYYFPVEGGEVIFNTNYEARGRLFGPLLAISDEIPEEGVKAAILNNTSLEFDVFSGLVSFPRTYIGACQLRPTGIKCPIGEYLPVEGERPVREKLLGVASRGSMRAPSSNTSFDEPAINPSTPASDVNQGVWSGQIHLEGRDIEQPFTMDVNLQNQTESHTAELGTQPITFTPKIHYTTYDPAKPLPRFFSLLLDAVRLPSNSAPLGASSLRGDMIRLTRWTNGSMAGTLYTADFGRVGTFELHRQRSEEDRIEFTSIAPRHYLSVPEYDASDRSRFLQMSFELDWTNGWAGKTPIPMLFGRMIFMYEGLPSGIPTNVLEESIMRTVRYDPFTGVFAADIGDTGRELVLMGVFENNIISMTRSANLWGVSPEDRSHHLITMTSGAPYTQPKLPDFATLPRDRVHIFMPHHAILKINGKRLADNRLVHRQFAWPKAWKGEPLTYTFEAIFRNGKTYSQKITLTRQDANSQPVIVNFYAMQ